MPRTMNPKQGIATSLNLCIDNLQTIMDSRNGIERLRKLVSGLAVQGRLVRQLPEDGNARDLLEDIAEARMKHCEDSNACSERINKSNKLPTLPPIEDGEIPFEIPDNWEWVRLGQIQTYAHGFVFNSDEYRDEGVGIVRIGDIQNGSIQTGNMARVGKEYLERLPRSMQVGPGSLVMAMSGSTTGKLGFNRTSQTFLLNQRVGKFNFPKPDCEHALYACLYLRTRIESNLKKSAGSAIPNLSTKQINELLFPLPPFAEQKRIVARVEKLTEWCDRLETTKEEERKCRISLNKAAFSRLAEAKDRKELLKRWKLCAKNFHAMEQTPENIASLRNTILQLAFAGWLAPQIHNEEPAERLLEKVQLIRLGKAPKNGQTGSNSGGGRPSGNTERQTLPKGWRSTILGEVAEVVMGQSPPGDSYNNAWEGVPLINGPADFSEEALGETQPQRYTTNPTKTCKRGDILVCVRGRTTGRTNIASHNLCIGRGVVAVHPYIYPRFVHWFMLHASKQLHDIRTGVTIKSVSCAKIVALPLLLPPLPEQKRIVAKVEKLTEYCRELEEHMGNRIAISSRFGSALVKSIVE